VYPLGFWQKFELPPSAGFSTMCIYGLELINGCQLECPRLKYENNLGLNIQKLKVKSKRSKKSLPKSKKKHLKKKYKMEKRGDMKHLSTEQRTRD
jgi:hypothetical protein